MYEWVKPVDFIAKEYEVINKRKKNKVYNVVCAFDTETSHNKENTKCWVYHWSLHLDNYNVIGRNLEEFIDVLLKLQEVNPYNFIIYVHNLSYDYHYLYKPMTEVFGEPTDFVAVKTHKVYQCKWANFIFKDSYCLTQMSLDKACKEYNLPVRKLTGTIDYKKIRYPYDELEAVDWEYMQHDTLCLKELIKKIMELKQCTLDELLMTSTQYAKLEVTKRYIEDFYTNKDDFVSRKYSVNAYKMLKSAFMGGYTHGSWRYYNETIRGNIKHVDLTSAYPSAMKTGKFPTTQLFKEWYELDDFDLNDMTDDKCYLIDIEFYNIRLRPGVTPTYIPFSKCECVNEKLDNGKVISADYLRMCLTDVDIKIIKMLYTCDNYRVFEVYTAKAGHLPKYILDTVDYFFKAKSDKKDELKEIKKKYGEDSEETREAEGDLQRTKATLNGLYGVLAQDPVRDEIENHGIEWKVTLGHTEETIEETIEKHYSNLRHINPKLSNEKWTEYPFAPWVTAQVRYQLISTIQKLGWENYLYCDTDSIFFIETEENKNVIAEINAEWKKENDANGYYIIMDNGTRVDYNNFDYEEPLRAFRYLQAKVYAMEVYEKKSNSYVLSCTIAGCSKFKNGISRNDELGHIDNLTWGMTFNKCGSQEMIYLEDGGIIHDTPHTLKARDLSYTIGMI